MSDNCGESRAGGDADVDASVHARRISLAADVGARGSHPACA
jgi:hypothetical protein